MSRNVNFRIEKDNTLNQVIETQNIILSQIEKSVVLSGLVLLNSDEITNSSRPVFAETSSEIFIDLGSWEETGVNTFTCRRTGSYLFEANIPSTSKFTSADGINTGTSTSTIVYSVGGTLFNELGVTTTFSAFIEAEEGQTFFPEIELRSGNSYQQNDTSVLYQFTLLE